jgi:hypothetical protein
MSFNYEDYKKNTKDFSLEEPFDFFFYRPLAYLLVKLTYKLPLTPNMFSLAALCFALIAGYSLSKGTQEGFIQGGLCIIIFGILDCCDGMLARMKKNGSMYGDLIDMFVDLLASINFYTGTFLGLRIIYSDSNFPFMVWPCAFLLLVHVGIYSFYKKQLLFYQSGNPNGRKREIDKYKREYEKLKKENKEIFNRFLLFLFLKFSDKQADESKRVEYHHNDYVQYNKKILPFWGIISGSTHLSILAISLIINELEVYIYFAFFLANMWVFMTYMIQNGVNNKLKRERV